MIGHRAQLHMCVYIQFYYKCDQLIKLGNQLIILNVNRA